MAEAGAMEGRGRGTSPGGRGEGLDLLRVPVLGPFLRWRHARSVLQGVFLVLAFAVILDGLFGPSTASRNLAGTLPWVHWRGFVVLGLLVAGNLFCMACPFMLPRRLAKRFGPARASWPAPLRSKWLAVGLLLLFFWAYEAFALWDSPWLTAWIAVTYFVLAFTVDAFFRGAAFCKYVCPIGQFHFVNGMVSPTEVRVRDPDVCGECRTLDCIRGRYEPARAAAAASAPIELDGASGSARLRVPGADGTDGANGDRAGARPRAPDAASGRAFGRAGLVQGGCELALFQPRKEGNGDCTFCMECIHACPHDNVGIVVRSPLRELTVDPVRAGLGRLSRRPDRAALALLLVFGAFFNAFGMTRPVSGLRGWAGDALGIASPTLFLLLFFGAGLVAVPVVATAVTAWLSRAFSDGSDSLVRRASTYAWALVPLGLGMWTAHYLFHFLVGARAAVPAARRFLAGLGVGADEGSEWAGGSLVPEGWLLPIEILFLQAGLLLTLVASYRIARREEGTRRASLRAFLPWAVLATLLALAGIWLLDQPMEMRGTPHMP